MMQEANLNSSIIIPDPGTNTQMGNPGATTCYSATWPSPGHVFEAGFARQYGNYFEADTESTHWGSFWRRLPYGLPEQRRLQPAELLPRLVLAACLRRSHLENRWLRRAE